MSLEQWVQWLIRHNYAIEDNISGWRWWQGGTWHSAASEVDCVAAILADAKARGIKVPRTDDDRHAAGYGMSLTGDGRWRWDNLTGSKLGFGTLDECRAAIDAEMDKAEAQPTEKAKPEPPFKAGDWVQTVDTPSFVGRVLSCWSKYVVAEWRRIDRDWETKVWQLSTEGVQLIPPPPPFEDGYDHECRVPEKGDEWCSTSCDFWISGDTQRPDFGGRRWVRKPKAKPSIPETMSAAHAAGGKGWDGVADQEAELGRESLANDSRAYLPQVLVGAEGLCDTSITRRRFMESDGMILLVADEFETDMRGWV